MATSLPAPGYWEGEDVDHLDGGFEWAIAEELADRFDLTLDVVDVPFERIVAGELGGADLALAQISITDERGEVLDFSVPYATIDAGVLVRAGEELTDLKTAREQRWVVVRAARRRRTSCTTWCARTTSHSSSTTRWRPPTPSPHGTVDAALMDLPTALVIARGRDDVTIAARFATAEEIGAALPEGSPNLDPVDAALRSLDGRRSLRRPRRRVAGAGVRHASRVPARDPGPLMAVPVFDRRPAPCSC